MTNEEIQRTMEFILEGQARFDARVAKDEERSARLEESLMRLDEALVTLVEIARITDERQDETDKRVETSDGRMSRLENAFATLVDLARIADERQDKADQRQDRTDQSQDTFDDKLLALTETLALSEAKFGARMEKDEGRTAQLEAAFVTLAEIARITDERQDETDQLVDRFDEKLAALVDAQLLSEAKLAELAQHLNALIDVVERHISKGHNGTAEA